MWYRALSFKLIISLCLVIIAGTGIFTYVSLTNFREQLIGEVFLGATRISDTVKASTRYYDRLINRRDALQNMIATIGKLAATVAHEINNLITDILTYTKLLRRKLKEGIPGNEDLQKFQGYMATMERETERCGTIARNMLDFARQREPSYKPDIDVNMTINESLAGC